MTVAAYGSPQVVQMPPQNVAFLHTDPPGCPTSRIWKIYNDTKYYAQVRMNGVAMSFMDNNVSLPHLPPRKEAWFCVHRFTELDLEWMGYLPPDFTNPVVDCEEKDFLSPEPGWDGPETGLHAYHCHLHYSQKQ
jgi:hypothetical protein